MNVRRIVLSLAAAAALAFPAAAANITSTSLRIQGAGLQIADDSKTVTTGIDIPVTVQTVFGGKMNDEAVNLPEVTVLGELTGPGLENPIQLSTAPGHKFQIPGLAQLGTYYLQNVRMMKGTEFLQYATPSVAVITVADVLQTKVTVKQLSPEELRARGITIDSRNFDVYEYTFTFIVQGQEVKIPFPVVIDPKTHQALPIARESEYVLPSAKLITPPRWTPPAIIPTEFVEEGDLPEPGQDEKEGEKGGVRPSIPAAIVIPNSLAVLHHFFAVGLMVTNGSPSGSTARLEDIHATIRIPTALRTVKTSPSVAFGQAVPIVEPTTGVTFLIAQSRGEAEWTLEGLQPGTHRIDFDLRATLKQQGQDDIPLKAAPSASIVIHDPRFNITFAHPDVVRTGIEYSTYAFITNMSPDAQTIAVTSEVKPCSEAPPDANTCRLNGGQSDLMTIPAGDMRVIEYKLRPGVTGSVFATAGTISDTGTLSASVKLTMGVSLTGIPLSPATLIMPYYAQFVEPDVVSANLMLLGLGYSLATAPLNAMTAKFPRVIKTDVFQRAVDVSRAGQRIFITNASPAEKRDAYTHLVLDLLGNGGIELREWDALRRRDGEKSGRLAGASVVRQLEATGLTNGTSITTFANTFASTTAHRQGYLAVFAHGTATGTRPYAISLTGKTTTAVTDIPNEATAGGWKRGLPFSDVSQFNGPSGTGAENGELALVGRWTEDLDVTVTPAQDGNLAIDLIYPQSATADGRLLRAHFDVANARKDMNIVIAVTRGAQTLNAYNGTTIVATGTVTTVDPMPLRIAGARQDLHQDEEGHKVSLLYNRPVNVQNGVVLSTKYTGTIDFNKDDVQYSAPRPISAAALQSDDRTVNITFDHALHQNGTYLIASGSLIDPTTSADTSFPDKVAPKIDNDLPAGIVFGHVVKGDNSAIGNAEVILRQYKPNDTRDPSAPPQYDLTRTSDGAFLFEFVRRQTDAGYSGAYRIEATAPDGKHTTMEASVRLPGKVHKITLQFLGRGAAEGYVRYNDGSIVAGAKVVIGSTMFDQFRSATADNAGYYRIDDLPVGPLTFSATDEAGNVTFASNEIATPGQLVTQNLSIYRKPFPGTGRVYGVVRRSDTNKVVAGAHVGVYSQGYGLVDGFTDSEGRFDFPKVPSGFVTLLASEWSVSRTAIALDFDLKSDEVKQADLLLSVPSTEKYASLTGVVWRENPLQPGQYERVAGALVKISNYRIVTANAQGEFTYDEIPVSFSDRGITAYDPATQRVKTVNVPSLSELPAANSMSIFINAFDRGAGNIRVRLLNSAGNPVPGYRVIVPGFPPDVLPEISAGVYELKNVPVGAKYNIWAVPKSTRPPTGTDPRPYGDQMTSGSSKVEFNGHVAALTLRLPGQGTVRVKVRSQFDLITPVNLTYSVWSEQEQGTEPLTLTQSTNNNGNADYAVFTSIPALSGYNAASAHPQYGYASVNAQLAYDGALNNHTLQLNTLATVRGQVYAIDGVTPVAGATVTIYNGRSDPGPQLTGPDGRFEFPDQPSSVAVTVTAQVTQSGIYRTGFSVAYTPPNGGSVDNMSVVLRKRGFVDGRVVYKDYKTYDPNNPANNVPDNTPNDLSDNAPVPLAKFYLRELDFPYRSFGQSTVPLAADITGRFVINNVFVGALRATAWDSGNEELRGDWQGSIDEEGADAAPKAYIAISGGGGGVGGAKISVVDPNQSYKEVANAEVSLYRGGGRAFDFGSTDATGFVEFSQLPVGSYNISAYSKALGKTSRTKTINVTANGIAVERLELEFSGVVDGTFTDPMANNKPIPGAIVRLTASNYSTNSSTDVNGFFIFNGVREGAFSLDVKDTESNRRAHRDNSLTVLDPHRTVNLELEPTDTLYFAAYLPNDTGGNSGVLAPPVTAEVTQRCWTVNYARQCDYLRELQGNPLVFTSALKNVGWGIGITEIGGQQRTAGIGGSFPYGTQSNPATYVWPAYGDVNVTVTQAGAVAAGAKVSISGGGKTVTVYTDSAGLATARGLQLNTGIYIQATSVDGRFTGSASTTIQRTSQPASASIALGSYAGVTGRVFSEVDGSPSVGTLVFAYFGSSTAQMRTDGEGRYTILGIPTVGTSGTTVNLTFIGPDDTTVGGYRSKTVFATSGVATVDDIRLDATAPQLDSIVPADGSMNVSPDTSIAITFSEPLATGTIHNGTFQLLDADGASTSKNISWQTLANGKFVVTLTIPKPAAGFPLRSNTLYRVIVTNGVTDVTGHSIPVTRGFSFTTSDYAEPRVQRVLPASPIPRETTFQFTFNEPIDPAPWSTGGNGVFHIYKLASPGGASAAIVRELGARAFVDPATLMSLFIAPADNDPIAPESFYRVVFAGVRDPQGNVLAEQTYHFFSFDEVDPYVVFTNPPAGEQLVSGSEYELRIELHNGSATGSIATDVAKVDYFTVAANGTETPFAAVTKAPFSTKILGPEAPAGGATLTVGAQATDTSGRRGPKATAQWTVKPNAAPTNVVVTPLQATAYPSNKVSASVTFEDEGSFASVVMTFTVPLTTGSTSVPVTKTQSYTRNANGTWPQATFTFDLPVTAQPGTNATFSTVVNDVRGLSSAPVTATTAVAEDLIQPQIITVLPPPNTTYFKDQTFTVDATVKDNETTVQTVTFFVDGNPVAVASSSTDAATGRQTFRSVSTKVPPVADDTNIPIVVTAKDYNNNTKSTTFNVLYKGVNDPDAPKVTWLCPIDKAAIPADYDNFALKLRISAVDQDVTSVSFTANTPTPITATGARDTSTTYDWTGTLNFTRTPAPGTVVITVTVKDTVSTHQVDLPITLDVVRTDIVLSGAQAISDLNINTYQGKSVALVGTAAVLAPQLPVAFENLLVLNGARVETLATTTTKEYKVDFTVKGITYVDCDSSINVTQKGYAGGWQNTTDGQNNDFHGRTVGNTTTGGADASSQGSHAGIGGIGGGDGQTNAVYGSITRPSDLGSGGGGSPACCSVGAPGGGAVALHGGSGENDASRIVIAGAVRADGGDGVVWAAGSGGSIWLEGKQVLFGPRTVVTANGGDDPASATGSWGAGGGRASISATTKLDVSAALISARGGRNSTGAENRSFVDGGAGTIFIKKPGQDLGELTVSSYDTRFPNTINLTRPTPIGRIGRGTSTAVAANALTDSARTFDKWMIGEELFLAGNTTRSFTVTGISADSKTLQTDAADGSLLTVATSQSVAYEGALLFDKVTAGKRALLRFDNRVASAGALDDVTAMVVDPTAAVALIDDKPTLTFSSTPAEGGNVVLDTSLSTTYSVTSTPGVRSVTLTWTPETTPRVDTYNDYPTPTASKTVALTVPSTTPVGPATLTFKVVDRAGRTHTLAPAKTYTITANSAPIIDTYTVAPPSLYAGHDVVATVTAHDDISVKTISFDAKLNGTSIKTQSFTPNTVSATQAFTVSIPKETAGASPLTIDVSVSDGFAGRAPTISTQPVTISTDTGKPNLSVIAPASGAAYNESSVFNVHVTATDTEVSVKEVFVQIDGGTAIPLAQVTGTSDWRGDVTVPPVDGDQDVPAVLTITAKDYAGNAKTSDPINLTFKAIVNPDAPTLAWSCTTDGAMFPAGWSAKLRVTAVAANAQNPVQTVQMFVNGSSTSLTVTSLGSNLYEATYPIPANATDGEIVQVRAVAKSAGGATSDLLTKFTVVVPETGVARITANTTIDTNTTTWNDKTLIIESGTVTIRGPHTFKRVLLLGGAIVHATLEKVELTTTQGMYVACGAVVDANSLGYGSGQTYPGESGPTDINNGGSHIGRSGLWGGAQGSTYGSVYRPQEHGAGGNSVRGGGVIRITSAAIAVDGIVRANGQTQSSGAGAGGSVWITTGKITGAGSVEAYGGWNSNCCGYAGGGGGAVAVEYTDATSVLPTLRAPGQSSYRQPGAGSVYVKGPGSTYGDFWADNNGIAGDLTLLPSLGSGTALTGTTGTTLVTDRGANIQPYFAGNWVEITSAAGTVKGTWRIATVTANSKTVTLAPNGSETISLEVGDKWKGVYLFDAMRAWNGARVYSTDPIRGASLDIAGSNVELQTPLTATTTTVRGNASAHTINGTSLTVESTGVLHQWLAGPSLTLNVGTVTVKSGGSIDVSAQGYFNGATYPGESGPSDINNGGSHIGRSGLWGGTQGTTYGSVYRPQEHGAGGNNVRGGGVARINASTVVIDGAIRANGQAQSSGAGAGGSIWISTGKITGSGVIEAVGGQNTNCCGYAAGGGGAVSIEYTDPTSALPTLRAPSISSYRQAGAGSIYVKGAGAQYGDLTVDNNNVNGELTMLPSLGNGTALAGTTGTTLVTDRSANIQPYFAGHWVEITSATGTVKGLWRIATVTPNSKTVTLAPNGTETLSLAVGDKWQGVYLFDTVRIANGGKIYSLDPVRASNLDTAGSIVEMITPISTASTTIRGTLYATSITGTDLTVESGGTLRQYWTPGSLTVNVQTLNVKSGGSIDVGWQGYGHGTTYPGESYGSDINNGGSHMGRSGLWSGTQGTTYGSVYRPQENGAGGNNVRGGGVLRVIASNVTVDGGIYSNGQTTNSGPGAGGSIWITTGKISGGGIIQANGGQNTNCCGYGAGGGGAVAVEYTDPASVLPTLRASAVSSYRQAGAGTVYIKGPNTPYGDLAVDNSSINGELTILPSLGNGAALTGTGGATLVTDRSANIQPYFAGHWVEITSAGGTVKGLWRIDTVTPNSKTVTLAPNGTETISLEVGDKWQGLYLFNTVRVSNGGKILSADPIRSTGIDAVGTITEIINPIVATSSTIRGTLYTTSITGTDLTVESGGQLRQYWTPGSLTLNLQTLNVKSGGTIDVGWQGYGHATTYPNESYGSDSNNGGAHIGRSGAWSGTLGSTYGSVYRPQENGAGGNNSRGGGVLRVIASNVTVEGGIYSNGQTISQGAGAGGSIWITTAKITGGGVIQANGGQDTNCCGYAGGGGGAVSVEYTDSTSVLPTLKASAVASYRNAGAGSVYTKGPSNTYGDLTINNNGISGQATVLPSLGRGNAVTGTSGANVVTDFYANFQPYFVGHWVDIYAAGTNTKKGTWRIASITGKNFTLQPNGNETVDVVPGDWWRGVYLFDKLTLSSTNVLLLDDLRATRAGDSSPLTINDAPFVNAPLISTQSRPDGDFVVGAAGAVSDLHPPIYVSAVNKRTGAGTAAYQAASDGSFLIPVSGEVGDTFKVLASDSFNPWAASRYHDVSGALANINGVASVTLTPSQTLSGSKVSGVVRLLYPALSGRNTVTLSSNNASAVVPATVTIAPGSATGQFDVTTSTVATETTATITATGATAAASATLTLQPASSGVSQVTLTPNSLEGGTSINATVVLAAPAPAGGALVSLASSDTRLASVQDVVLVPAGNTSAPFTVTTYRVASQSNVSISATYLSSASASATLTACSALGSVAPPASTTLGFTWIDDAVPSGSTPSGDAVIDSTQSASGTSSIHFSGASAGTRTFGMTTTTTMTVNPSDNLVVYALVNPCNPPKQIMLQWKVGSTEYRATWGENRVDPVATPALTIGSLPSSGGWTRLEVLAKSIGIGAAVNVSDLLIRVVDGEAWIDKVGKSSCAFATAAPPQFGTAEQVWFDDTLPAGATEQAPDTVNTTWTWDSSQSASGSTSHKQSSTTTPKQHYMNGASSPLAPSRNDLLFTYALLDPCDPPKQIILQWYDGTWHAAYWGDNVVSTSIIGSNRWRVGPLPDPGKWARLEVNAADLGLANRSITGMAFLISNGQAWFDRAGKAARVNLAFLKNATQSSNYTVDYPASRAVDGITTSGGTNMSITVYGSQPWWQVDLGDVYPVDQINIYGRTDCCTSQTGNFYLQTSDVPFASNTLSTNIAQSGVSSYGIPGQAGSLLSFGVRRTARYVRVQLAGTDNLTIPEVEVFAPSSKQRVNLAGGRTATSSSIWDTWTHPWFAINGTTNQAYQSGGSLFHIRNGGDTDAWWQVDLGAVSPISTIDLYTRAESQYQDQMINLYVIVSDAPFTSQSFAPTVAQAGVSIYYTGTTPRPIVSIPINRTGRYVRVQKPGTSQSFSLGEVEIWGQQPALLPMSKPEQSQ
jgi:hypothetical protein